MSTRHNKILARFSSYLLDSDDKDSPNIFITILERIAKEDDEKYDDEIMNEGFRNICNRIYADCKYEENSKEYALFLKGERLAINYLNS